MTDLATLIRQGALQRGLDPRAVLAVAGQEGLGGGIGDNNTSFGPFQLHYGGAYPGHAPQGNPTASQAWAMSPAGVNYALDKIASVARGLTGRAAIDAIVHKFERPRDPAGEAARAWGTYGSTPSAGALTTPQRTAAGTPRALPAGMPQAKIPGLIQPGFPDLAPIILSGKSGSALTDALIGRSMKASDFALAKLPRFPVSPKDMTGVMPVSSPPGASVEGFVPGSPVPGDKPMPGFGHGTSGLSGYTGQDYMAPAGSKAVAPVSGKVVRLSGHDPKLGAVQGAGGPLGWSLYIQGNDGRTYYLTHMGSRTVKEGDTVKAGQAIGTVADYESFGRPDHIHMGYA